MLIGRGALVPTHFLCSTNVTASRRLHPHALLSMSDISSFIFGNIIILFGKLFFKKLTGARGRPEAKCVSRSCCYKKVRGRPEAKCDFPNQHY